MSAASRRQAYDWPRPGPESAVFLVGALVAVAWVIGTGAGNGPTAAGVLALAVAVALVGLPHGGLDGWVARRSGLYRGAGGWVAFHALYVLLAMAVALLWLWLPAASLLGFLLLSAWHFAGDWPGLPAPLRMLAGVALLGLPAWLWAQPVATLFEILAGTGGLRLAGVLSTLGPLFVLLLAGAAWALRRHPIASAEVIALALLALLAPPLVFFGVYFCLLHSPRQLRLGLALVEPARRRQLLGVAAAYAAASVVLVLVAGLAATAWLDGSPAWIAGIDTAQGLRLVFIGLAALTVPHMAVAWLAARRLKEKT